MAKLYIAEYVNLGETGRGAPQAPLDPPLIEQTPVVIGAGSLQSAAFQPTTRFILIATDAICSVVVGGTNPTATTNNHRMAADQAEYRAVTGGDKLAVIANT